MRNSLDASSLRSAWTKGRLTGSLQSPKEQDSLANWGAQGQTAPQKARWLRQAWLVVVLAEIRLIVVISQALSSRYSTAADDAGLQIRDYGVHLTGGKLAGCWLKVIRRRTQWPPVTWMNGVCAILESGLPVPTRPQRTVVFSASLSSLVVRKSADGATSPTIAASSQRGSASGCSWKRTKSQSGKFRLFIPQQQRGSPSFRCLDPLRRLAATIERD